jgi:hypothetical protein
MRECPLKHKKNKNQKKAKAVAVVFHVPEEPQIIQID